MNNLFYPPETEEMLLHKFLVFLGHGTRIVALKVIFPIRGGKSPLGIVPQRRFNRCRTLALVTSSVLWHSKSCTIDSKKAPHGRKAGKSCRFESKYLSHWYRFLCLHSEQVYHTLSNSHLQVASQSTDRTSSQDLPLICTGFPVASCSRTNRCQI